MSLFLLALLSFIVASIMAAIIDDCCEQRRRRELEKRVAKIYRSELKGKRE